MPGPSAAIAALVVSGLPTVGRLRGFLPKKQGERVRRLEALRHEPRTIVVFESPLRVQTLLRDVLVVDGRPRGGGGAGADEAARGGPGSREPGAVALADRELKGEVVVVIDGERVRPAPDMSACADEARELVAGGMRKRDAAHAVAERHGVSVNELYRALLDDVL